MDCKVRGYQYPVGVIDAHMYAHRTPSARMVSIVDIEGSMSHTVDVRAMQRVAEVITATQHHVCSVGRDPMLHVTPEVMWLIEENDFTGIFEVVSNVDWNVE